MLGDQVGSEFGKAAFRFGGVSGADHDEVFDAGFHCAVDGFLGAPKIHHEGLVVAGVRAGTCAKDHFIAARESVIEIALQVAFDDLDIIGSRELVGVAHHGYRLDTGFGKQGNKPPRDFSCRSDQ